MVDIYDINIKTQKIVEDPDLDFNPKRGWIRVVPYKDFLKKCSKIDKVRLELHSQMNENTFKIMDIIDKDKK